MAFEEVFSERFGVSPPEELNTEHTLNVVASDVDPATARIVEYLARTWLFDDARPGGGGSKPGRMETWNGHDWYVSFGEESGIRSWDDARKYGFVSAGGGVWYSRTLRALPIGARVFVCIPGSGLGYVGVGTVAGEAMRYDDAVLTVDGAETKMTDLPLAGTYRHLNGAENNDEYVVPVEWIKTVDRSDAVWEKGFFANQNSACKLRNRFTLEGLTRRFNLGD